MCKTVKREVGVEDVPDELFFPQGIRVRSSYQQGSIFVNNHLLQLGYFYNFCGLEDWTFSGQIRQGNNICCKVNTMVLTRPANNSKPAGHLIHQSKTY